ncbi:hypothetical protein K440DRAFT_636936 [Wilcoxina mikolae CBS 423.85]|nr:hypothetical protein K440DRAFT_636936 [Wilcoxina mikolae CBS 423.85]
MVMAHEMKRMKYNPFNSGQNRSAAAKNGGVRKNLPGPRKLQQKKLDQHFEGVREEVPGEGAKGEEGDEGVTKGDGENHLGRNDCEAEIEGIEEGEEREGSP